MHLTNIPINCTKDAITCLDYVFTTYNNYKKQKHLQLRKKYARIEKCLKII